MRSPIGSKFQIVQSAWVYTVHRVIITIRIPVVTILCGVLGDEAAEVGVIIPGAELDEVGFLVPILACIADGDIA